MSDQTVPGGLTSALWARIWKRIEAAIADTITSRVVIQDFGTGFIEVTSGDPEDTSRRTIPRASVLSVEPGDVVLTQKIGGRETATQVLTGAGSSGGGGDVSLTGTQTLTNKTLTSPTINGSAKTTPADADEFLIKDSAASGITKELTLANFIINYLDSRYYEGTAIDALIAGLTSSLDLRRPLFPMLSGRKYDTMTHGLGKGGATTAVSLPANTLRLTPLNIPNAVTLNNIGIYVQTGIAGNLRLGIFTFDTATHLATLVLDCGTATTTAAAAKNLTISQAVAAGQLYVGVVSDVAVLIYQVAPASGMEHNPTLNTVAAWSKAYTYAAFTATITAVSTVDANMPIIWVGVA